MTWKWEWLARNPSEMWSDITKCGLRSPKVAFSNVIFHFIFTDIFSVECCRMRKWFHSVSFTIPRGISSILCQPVMHSCLCNLIGSHQRSHIPGIYAPWRYVVSVTHANITFSPSSWNPHGSWWPDQVHWSSLGGVFLCDDLISHLPSTVIVKQIGLWNFQSDLQ